MSDPIKVAAWSVGGASDAQRLPVFAAECGKPSTALIYSSHYDRLQAVIDAVRSGNALLIELALQYHDQHGSSPFPDEFAS